MFRLKGCSERKSGNRAVADVVGAGDLAHGLAVAVAAANRFSLLVFGQFRLSTEPDTARLGAFASFAGSRAD